MTAPERDLMAAVLQKAVEDIKFPYKSRLRKHIVCSGDGIKTATVRERDKPARQVPCPCDRLKKHLCRMSVTPKDHNDALEWVMKDKDDHLFSFVSICNHLDINPGIVRKKLGMIQ